MGEFWTKVVKAKGNKRTAITHRSTESFARGETYQQNKTVRMTVRYLI